MSTPTAVRAAALLAALTASSTALAASPTYYATRANFMAWTGLNVVDDYSNPGYAATQDDATMSAVVGETDYLTTGFPNLNQVTAGQFYCSGCGGSFQLGFTTTSFVLPGLGTPQVGVNIRTNGTTPAQPFPAYTATIGFGDGTFEEVVLPVGASFLGIREETATVVSIHFALPGGVPATTGNFSIREVIVGDPAVDLDGDGFSNVVDCNDSDPAINPNATEVPCNGVDEDCDPATIDDENLDGDPVSVCGGDCDDSDGSVYPGNAEIVCNGVDNDCDGLTGDDFDGDLDGISYCDGDCDDTDPAAGLAGVEVCDGTDGDCNGFVDDVGGTADTDGDGVYDGCDACAAGDDTQDADGDGVPNACDTCDVSLGDSDGDGVCDEQDLCDGDDASGDSDGDGFCATRGGAVWDCDDGNPAVHPGAPELCDGLDNSCAGFQPAEDADTDGDGASICDGDCNDQDPAVGQDAEELCDGVDNDCDGEVDEDCPADGTDTGVGGRYLIDDQGGCRCDSSTGPGAAWLGLSLFFLLGLRRRGEAR